MECRLLSKMMRFERSGHPLGRNDVTDVHTVIQRQQTAQLFLKFSKRSRVPCLSQIQYLRISCLMPCWRVALVWRHSTYSVLPLFGRSVWRRSDGTTDRLVSPAGQDLAGKSAREFGTRAGVKLDFLIPHLSIRGGFGLPKNLSPDGEVATLFGSEVGF